jgi:uncharacterized Zn finger protein (UPF0148 family)
MQAGSAYKLHKDWGDKPCDHPHIAPEYVQGSNTGDFCCTTCGKAFGSVEEWEKGQTKGQKNQPSIPPSLTNSIDAGDPNSAVSMTKSIVADYAKKDQKTPRTFNG